VQSHKLRPLSNFSQSSQGGAGPSQLRELGLWTSPRPTTLPDLDSSASSACNRSTNLNGLTSLHGGPPLIPPTTPESQRTRRARQLSGGSNLNTPVDLNGLPQTLHFATVSPTRDFRSSEQAVRTTEPTHSHSPYTPSLGTNDSMRGFSIRLHKPQPTQNAVISLRIENHVYLDIQLPKTWNAVQVPLTTSVKHVDALSSDEDINPLTLDIVVRGATTGQECDGVCGQCAERIGRRMGRPSLIDFHGPSNIIRPKKGTARVHFTFCCYSRHHLEEDKQFMYVTMALLMSRLPVYPFYQSRSDP
jgi:hypothetical protein